MKTSRISRRRFLEALGVAGASVLGASSGCRTAGDRPDLITRQESPLNAEPALEQLARSWITPLNHFYIRRHGPVPVIDPGLYELRLAGLVERPLRLALGRLRSEFEKGSVTATLQCAGNRRSEHSRQKKVGGVQWDAGAIGNAHWGGARLGDILKRAGLKAQARHVWFRSLDECVTPGGTVEYGGSIPLEKALESEALVAYEMNGEALSSEHGFPARAVVPGYIGARSVKWLGEIIVSDRPSDNFFHARDYKLFPPEVGAETARWEEAAPLDGMPTNSAICSPATGQSVKAGALRVRGYALAATGHAITRVQVSPDDGKAWMDASLLSQQAPFAWRLWEADVPVRAGAVVLAVRAWDSSGSAQPEKAAWNFKGYLYNAWHRVPLTVA